MIRVMVCDDLQDICDFLSEKINSQPDMEVVCTASCEQESIELAKKHKPDIILMDIQMDEYNSGVNATEKIMAALPKTKIIMLTIHRTDDLIVNSYIAGAVDYVLKDSPPEMIYNSIRSVYESSEFLGRTIANAVYHHMKSTTDLEPSINYMINHLSKLTPVEIEIVKLLYCKKNRREIAKEKGLSENTVKQHIWHILRKLDFDSTSEMTAFLRKLNIIEYL